MDAHGSVPSSYIDAIAEDVGSLPDAIRRALLSVPRHRFLDGWFRLEVDGLQANYRRVEFDRDHPNDEALGDIYSDRALMTAHDGTFATSSTSQPSLVTRMLAALDVRPGMRILEIGTGTGYNAALLAELCGDASRVVSIECQKRVADKARRFLHEEGYGAIRVIHRDGFHGLDDAEPFDRIIATIGCSDVSPHWVKQLAPGGVLLVPLEHGLADPLTRFTPAFDHPGSLTGRVVGRATFMRIQGTLERENPWQTLNKARLQHSLQWCRPLPAVLDASATHPFHAPDHWGFRFYLALRSENLWYDNTGYGLADDVGSCIVKFTPQGVEAYASSVDADCSERLYSGLLSLVDEWNALGRPAPTAYDIYLCPPAEFEIPSEHPEQEWRIERMHHIETLRLP